MTKKSPIELLPMLSITDTETKLKPPHLALEFFRGLQLHLEATPWDTHYEHGTRFDEFHTADVRVDNDAFSGRISWMTEGPKELLDIDVPTEPARLETKIFVHDGDWRTQAELKLTRNVLTFGVVNLTEGTSTTYAPSDLLFFDADFEVDDPNERDRLSTRYSASTGFSPKGRWEGIRAIRNSGSQVRRRTSDDDFNAWLASVRHETIKPIDEQLAALQESARLLAAAITYIRSHS